jgi:hypothetical protein
MIKASCNKLLSQSAIANLSLFRIALNGETALYQAHPKRYETRVSASIRHIER